MDETDGVCGARVLCVGLRGTGGKRLHTRNARPGLEVGRCAATNTTAPAGFRHVPRDNACGEFGPRNLEVNVVDWAFQFDNRIDGAVFKGLEYSDDVWYGSTYWTGPDWTRVGKDWQHSGEHTSSIRLFTVPRDGQVVVSGSVCKADTNGGDGVRVSIRHNAEVVWQRDIEANDARGADPGLALDVRAGDRIRFAVHRRDAITCDTTHWDPVITYADGTSFRASDGFGPQPQGGWSYEMETETVMGLPRFYSFDDHFCFHEYLLSRGGRVELNSATTLPVFILADDKDSCGIMGAVITTCPWRLEVSFSEDGQLALRIRNEVGGSLPVVVTGAYKGTWRNGAARLERLRRSNSLQSDLGPFQDVLLKAFNQVLGERLPNAAPELDLWADVQWDWHRQDKLEETPQGYEAAIPAVTRKSELSPRIWALTMQVRIQSIPKMKRRAFAIRVPMPNAERWRWTIR